MASVMTQGSTTDLEQRMAEQAANPNPPPVPLTDQIRDMFPKMVEAMPDSLAPERFQRSVFTLLSKTPELYECTPSSIKGAVMTAAQLGLEFGPLGLAFLVPFRDDGVKICTLMIGYKGYIQLTRRSGVVKDIIAIAVHEKDKFEYWNDELGTHLYHEPFLGGADERGPAVRYYGRATYTNGGSTVMVLELSDINKRKARSATANHSRSPWKSDEEAMRLKTCIRAMVPWLPLSAEDAEMVTRDEQLVDMKTDGTLNVGFVDATAAEITPKSAEREGMEGDLELVLAPLKPAQRRACESWIAAQLGSAAEITEEGLKVAIDVAKGWPGSRKLWEALKASLPVSTGSPASKPVEAHTDENQAGSGQSSDGDPGPQEPPPHDDEPFGTEVRTEPERTDVNGVSRDLYEDTLSKVGTWDQTVIERIMKEQGIYKADSLVRMRARLVTHLANGRAKGDLGIIELF